MDVKTALEKYRTKKGSTKRRKDKNGDQIEFRLTFEEWCQIWLESGKIDQMGCRKGQYVMSRFNDIGHYEIGNVEIKTCSENSIEAHKGKKCLTPDGEFKSAKEAAESLNEDYGKLSVWCRNGLNGYKYL